MIFSCNRLYSGLFCLSFLFLFVNDGVAQLKPGKFIQETHYLISLPDGYAVDTAKRWPLLIFLHGSGESGDDLTKVKVHGPPKLVEQGKKFPFIVVSPQAPIGDGWQTSTLYKLLQHIKSTERVDHRRIYLTGLSMGGYGTWNLAMEYPGEFAAIAPVCGGGDSSRAWRLRHMGIWNFHGAKDDVVYPIESEKMVKAAKKENPNVRYTLYPEANHNSWDLTYSNDSLYDWFLEHTRFEYKQVEVNDGTLKKYSGMYSAGAKDSIEVKFINNSLVAFPGHDSVPLLPAGNDIFFIAPDLPVEIIFQKKAGKVKGFTVIDNRRIFYRKVK